MTRLKQVARVMLFVAALMAISLVLGAQTIPPINTLRVEPEAKGFLDSLAAKSSKQQVELAGCLTSYAVEDSTLVLKQFVPAVFDSSDATSISASGPICVLGTPTLHTHLDLPGVLRGPSSIDRQTSSRLGTWALILVLSNATWALVVY